MSSIGIRPDFNLQGGPPPRELSEPMSVFLLADTVASHTFRGLGNHPPFFLREIPVCGSLFFPSPYLLFFSPQNVKEWFLWVSRQNFPPLFPPVTICRPNLLFFFRTQYIAFPPFLETSEKMSPPIRLELQVPPSPPPLKMRFLFFSGLEATSRFLTRPK